MGLFMLVVSASGLPKDKSLELVGDLELTLSLELRLPPGVNRECMEG